MMYGIYLETVPDESANDSAYVLSAILDFIESGKTRMKSLPVLSSRYCPSGIRLVAQAVRIRISPKKTIYNPFRIIFANLQNRLVLSRNQIKHIRSLHQKKFRDATGQFIVEGEKQVDELLQSDYRVLELFATDNWKGNVDHVRVSPAELERLSTVKTPNHVIALVEQKQDVSKKEDGLILVLDGIRDPGNMGTIIRSASWFGVSQLWCSDDCVDIYNPKVVRSSMGALFKLEVCQTNLVESLSNYPHTKAGLVLGGKDPLTSIHQRNCAVVLGNESSGISPGVVACLDASIEIGGSGMMESLNAAMAGTIVLYEWFRSFE